MADHASRFPGVSNDPAKHQLTGKQAARLAGLVARPASELAGKTLAQLQPSLQHLIDPNLFLFRRVCGQVVKTDAAGNDRPVPFATVTVYDTDFGLLAWSPVGSPYSWFLPFGQRREVLAKVTTDECGRFCVWIPRFDIDHYLKWRLERRCYLTWLRHPSIADVLREREVVPDPDPGPLHLDEHVLTHAARVLEPRAVERLRAVAQPAKVGTNVTVSADALAKRAFPDRVRPPIDRAAAKELASGLGERLAKRVGLPSEAITKLDLSRFWGPFLRCHWVLTPQWTTVLDIPDITFEVTQDVNGDGTQEVIYAEGLFDVRWDASSIPDVVLHASEIALTSPSCDIPEIGPCGEPAILFASNYPLQVPASPSDYHDAGTGYALRPNRPDENGIPNEGLRVEPAHAPFVGSFYLVGCAERAGATHYRVHHQVGGGATTFLNGGYGPLMKVVGGVLQQLMVDPVGGQWYPIVPRADGWTPVGILAPVSAGGNDDHAFRLEFGQLAGAAINPIAGSLTPPVHVHIDNTAPQVDVQALQWRQPDTSAAWSSLSLGNCPVVSRTTAGRLQFRLRVSVTANHLRDVSISASGCGAATPRLIVDGRDGLPVPAADAAAHWHTGPADNTHVCELHYELAAGAPAGCYHFTIFAASRSFAPTGVGGPDWRIDTAPIYVQPSYAVSVQ